MTFPTPPDGDWPTRQSQPSQPVYPPNMPPYPGMPSQPYQPGIPYQPGMPSQPGQPGYGYPGYTTVPLYGVPVPQYQPPVQAPAPKQGALAWIKAHWIVSGCAGLIVLCLACSTLGAIANAMNGGSGGTASATTTSAPQATHPPKPTATTDPNAGASTYISLVQTDVATLSTDLDTFSADCGNVSNGDFSTCRADVVTFRNDVNSFQNDLNKTPAPPCLTTEDQHLRAALQDYKTGADQVIAGIDDISTDEVSAGAALFTRGNGEITQATNAAKTAQCG